jgi:hypothetical protein
MLTGHTRHLSPAMGCESLGPFEALNEFELQHPPERTIASRWFAADSAGSVSEDFKIIQLSSGPVRNRTSPLQS